MAPRCPRPRRSVLFAAVAAEEQGLLGSEYPGRASALPARAAWPPTSTSTASTSWGRTRDIEMIGLGKSTLDDVVREIVARRRAARSSPTSSRTAASSIAPTSSTSPRPGVPAAYFHHGTDVIGKPPGWGKAVERALRGHRLPSAVATRCAGLGLGGRGGGRDASSTSWACAWPTRPQMPTLAARATSSRPRAKRRWRRPQSSLAFGPRAAGREAVNSRHAAATPGHCRAPQRLRLSAIVRRDAHRPRPRERDRGHRCRGVPRPFRGRGRRRRLRRARSRQLERHLRQRSRRHQERPARARRRDRGRRLALPLPRRRRAGGPRARKPPAGELRFGSPSSCGPRMRSTPIRAAWPPPFRERRRPRRAGAPARRRAVQSARTLDELGRAAARLMLEALPAQRAAVLVLRTATRRRRAVLRRARRPAPNGRSASARRSIAPGDAQPRAAFLSNDVLAVAPRARPACCRRRCAR